MSYLVFARKWRPMAFEDVVGQEHVTRTLKLAIEKKRVAHAYIFSGTRGVGKTTTARILARALNCEQGPTPNPCGTCDSCRTIIQGSSFDVLEIDGASNNSVDDIRELRENINYSSMGGKHRIYVIDEVHMLSKAAFNALLKTLEEPPKNVIFIFATTEPQKIPETIHSRCQRYDFRRISAEQIRGQLEKICTNEKISFDRESLMLIARKADGSMRDSLSLLDQVCSFCGETIAEKEVRSVLGVVGSEIYLRCMDAVAEKNPALLIETVEEVLATGYDLQEFLSGFDEHLRSLLFVRLPSVLQNQRVALSMEVSDELRKQSDRFDEADLLRMIEILHKAEADLRWSAYPRFVVEVALCRMAWLDSSVTLEQVVASLKDVPLPTLSASAAAGQKKKLAESVFIPPAVRRPMAPTPPVEPTGVDDLPDPVARQPESPEAEKQVVAPIASLPAQTVDADEFNEPVQQATQPFDPATRWRLFIEALMKERPNLGTFMSMATVVNTAESVVDVRFSSNYIFQFSEITKKSNRDFVEKKLSDVARCPMTLHITLEKRAPESTSSEQAAPSRPLYTPSLQDSIENEPVIKNVLEIFDGEVV